VFWLLGRLLHVVFWFLRAGFAGYDVKALQVVYCTVLYLVLLFCDCKSAACDVLCVYVICVSVLRPLFGDLSVSSLQVSRCYDASHAFLHIAALRACTAVCWTAWLQAAQGLKVQLDAQCKALDQLQGNVKMLEARLNEARNKRETLKARAASAKSSKQIQEVGQVVLFVCLFVCFLVYFFGNGSYCLCASSLLAVH
jgi:nitrogen fixation protein FixH